VTILGAPANPWVNVVPRSNDGLARLTLQNRPVAVAA
jgi:hypothetical protein